MALSIHCIKPLKGLSYVYIVKPPKGLSSKVFINEITNYILREHRDNSYYPYYFLGLILSITVRLLVEDLNFS